MKKNLYLAAVLMVCMFMSSCSDDGVETQPVVGNTQTDMEILSRFVDVNEDTNEYYINVNKKTRALSYVTGSDWADLEKVSPVNVAKYNQDLAALNAEVEKAIADPENAYMVFSVNGKTLVKQLRDTELEFVYTQTPGVSTRALPYSLGVFGGSSTTTGKFKDSSRTIRMDVNLVYYNYYTFQIASPDATVNPQSSIQTPSSVYFSGTGMLWNTSFIWTAYWDAQGSDGLFNWEFKSEGYTPQSGLIAQCTFSY